MANPYEAPRAEVADPEVEIVARPASVSLGLLILWIVLGLWLLGTLPHFRELGTLNGEWPILYAAYLVGMIVVPAWLLVMIARCRHWARVAAMMLQGVDFSWRLYLFLEIENAPESKLPYLLVPVVVQLAAFLLLCLPRANAWFRSRSGY